MSVVRTVAVLLVVASITPAATATADTRASEAQSQAGMPGDRFPTGAPDRSIPPSEPFRTPSSVSESGSSLAMVSLADDYYDECDDAGQADIARFGMSDDAGANVTFVWATCMGKPMRYADDEFVLFSIDADFYDPEFRSDWAVAQWMDGYYEVFRTYNDAPPEHWTSVDAGYGTVDGSNPGYTFAGFTIDAVRAGFPYEYHFAFQTFDAQGLRDMIPNPGHAAPTFPSQCDTYLLGHKAIVRTADVDATVTAARGAGLDVESIAPGIGAVTVSPVARLDDLSLPGQISVTRPVQLRLSAVNDPEPTQWAIDELDLARGWAVRSSARVEIAIVDSGIDAARADLAGRVASGFDGVTGRTIPAGSNSAFHPHGTAVAGIAAGTPNNDREVAGVNGGAIVRPYRVTGHNGPCVESGAVAAALDHIATVDSIRIVNMSLGGIHMDGTMRDAIRRVHATGKILIAASGNDGPTARANYPAGFPEVIGVGATGPGRTMAPYSQPANADVVAPGGYGSTRADAIATLHEWKSIEYGQGTSYAAPYVAGAVSLWLNGNRATTDQARVALHAAANDIPDTTADGKGLLNVATLLGAPPFRPTQTPHDPTDVCDSQQGTGFPDSAGNVHEYAIRCIVGAAITEGRQDGTYGPADPVSRGQVATFLVRTLDAAGTPVPANGPDAYTDDNGTAHEQSLNRLAAANIPPTRDTTVRPNDPATRAEMAEWVVSAVRYAGATHTDTTDWYHDDQGHRRERHINDLTGFAVVTGKGNGYYGPDERLSRAQMATFLARTLSLTTSAG